MDYFQALEAAMIEAGAAPDAARDAVDRMMERPAGDYCTDKIDELPVMNEMVAAGLSAAVAARIVLSLLEQFQAITPLHALAGMDLGDNWQFADEIDEEEGLDPIYIENEDLDQRRQEGEFNFLGFTCSYKLDW